MIPIHALSVWAKTTFQKKRRSSCASDPQIQRINITTHMTCSSLNTSKNPSNTLSNTVPSCSLIRSSLHFLNLELDN